MTFDSSPATFYRDELDAALREQLFGIRDYRITSSTSRQATAMLVTLEGLKLTIVLNSQGYSVLLPSKFKRFQRLTSIHSRLTLKGPTPSKRPRLFVSMNR